MTVPFCTCRPRLDGEEESKLEEKVEEEDVAQVVSEGQADSEAKAAPSVEVESVSQPKDNTADKIEDASENQTLGESGKKVENDTVMKNTESKDGEDKVRSSNTDSSVSGEKSEGKPEENEAKEVTDSGSGAGEDTPMKDASKVVQNGGVANQNGLDTAVKSDDSEKENQGRETPMDLTRKPPGPTDVITLSDESDEEDGRCTAMPNGYQELSTEEQLNRARLVKRLQVGLYFVILFPSSLPPSFTLVGGSCWFSAWLSWAWLGLAWIGLDCLCDGLPKSGWHCLRLIYFDVAFFRRHMSVPV